MVVEDLTRIYEILTQDEVEVAELKVTLNTKVKLQIIASLTFCSRYSKNVGHENIMIKPNNTRKMCKHNLVSADIYFLLSFSLFIFSIKIFALKKIQF